MAHTVVVGAGIAGACVAFGLAQRGEVVTVVDDAREGRATAAGAGIIQPWGSAATGTYYDLYARGAAYYPTFVEQLGELGITDLAYRRSGSLVVSDTPDDIDVVAARMRSRHAVAPEMGVAERLDGAGLRALFPPLRDGLHGLLVPGGGRVDGRRLVAGVLAAVEQLGGTVVHGTVRLHRQDGRVAVAVAVDGRRLAGERLVVAGGAWSTALLAPLGRTVDVEPQRGQITHLRLDGVDTSGWPTVVPVGDHYLVAFDRGRIVAGATRETGSGFDVRVTAEGQRQVLDQALALAPGLATATVLETRVGLRPLAAGGTPSVGAVPDLDDMFVATGYGAAGLTMAPALGDALAQLIVTGAAPFELPALPR